MFELSVSVYTDKFIDRNFVLDYFARYPKLVLAADKHNPGSLVVSKKRLFGRPKLGIVVSECASLALEFVSGSVKNIMQNPGWEIFIYAEEGCGIEMKPYMEGLYKALADRGNGFAYHSESGTVLYQSASMVEAVEKQPELDPVKGPYISLEWNISAKENPEDFLARVFDSWNSLDKRALPDRYGDSEPPRKTFSLQDKEQFSSYVKTARHVFWQGHVPYVRGNIFLGTDPYARNKTLQVKNCTLGLDVLCSALSDHPNMLETLEKIFVQTALLTNAHFASAVLIRMEPAQIGRKPQHMIDNYQLSFGPFWQGLPPLPVWMAWFGRAYFEHVRDTLAIRPDACIVEFQHMLLKLGEEPMNLDELKKVYPDLPSNLIAHEIVEKQEEGVTRSRAFNNAAFIPPELYD